jgi:hypothetical protein
METIVTQPESRVPILRRSYREAAAWNLYMIVRPAGGLKWINLSPQQQERYRTLIDRAVQATEVRA